MERSRRYRQVSLGGKTDRTWRVLVRKKKESGVTPITSLSNCGDAGAIPELRSREEPVGG